jgi:hypothetical protein
MELHFAGSPLSPQNPAVVASQAQPLALSQSNAFAWSSHEGWAAVYVVVAVSEAVVSFTVTIVDVWSPAAGLASRLEVHSTVAPDALLMKDSAGLAFISQVSSWLDTELVPGSSPSAKTH